jgi:hypothetical protein
LNDSNGSSWPVKSTLFVTFGGIVQQMMPTCVRCKTTSGQLLGTNLGTLCKSCVTKARIESSRKLAPQWLEAIFSAFEPEHHDEVYRNLAALLHPDTSTGDEGMMKALNAARDKIRLA